MFQRRVNMCGGSRNFCQVGLGPSHIKSSDNVFFSPQLILQKSNCNFQRKLSFSKVPEGVTHFLGGSVVQFFTGVRSNCLFPIENHITCDFPGRSGSNAPSLWIRPLKITSLKRLIVLLPVHILSFQRSPCA